jgi:hypothetical protein
MFTLFKKEIMRNFKTILFFVFLLVSTIVLSQKTVKVIHSFKGEGTIGTSKISINLNMLSNGVLKGYYLSQNSTFNLQGNQPIGESQQTTVYITENDIEKGYLIIPYDIEEIEVLIGKWYSIDGQKTQEFQVKRNH